MIPAALVLLGHPVAHSLSPVFQQAAIDAAGFAVRYTARDVMPSALDRALRELADMRAAGNVTIPHKEAVAAACARCTPIAARVGAVNTFWHDDDGALVGHNTDVEGAVAAINAVLPIDAREHADALQESVSPRVALPHVAPLRVTPLRVTPLRVTLLGAGGSAASVLVALESFGEIDLRIVARTPARADTLVQRLQLRALVGSDTLAAVADADLVINSTPIGLHDDTMPVAPSALPPHACVLDLVYRRGETAWVRTCRERGLRAEDGLRMLVEQGAAAFECWFGTPPDRDAMWRVLEPRSASAPR